jgi:hypothetical protein
MRRRCRAKNRKCFEHYGAKNITVCAEWESDFLAFLSDMGPRPTDGRYSVERIDRRGNYEPGNCKWATYVEQANNRSNNRLVVYRGEEMTVQNAIRRSGSAIRKNQVIRRINAGLDIETALTKPLGPTSHRRSKIGGEVHV